MKKIATLFCFILTFGLLNNSSFASHVLGAEIGYSIVSPGTYQAECKLFYDCGSGAAAPTPAISLNLTSPGCTANQVITANQLGSPRIIQTYCASTGNRCASNAPYTVLEVMYTAIFSAPVQCQEYYLSFTDGAAGSMVNLTNNTLYVEAYINTSVPVNSAVTPAFIELPTLYFAVNSPATFPNLAIDRTTVGLDSIGYLLKPAQQAHNSPIAYAGNSTHLDPITSATTASLHPASGLFSFSPNVFSNQPPVFTNNVYAVVVEASGYLKINGVMTRVSATQRRLPVSVMLNNSPNQNPQILNLTVNGQPLPATGISEVAEGSTVTIQFATADTNTADTVSFYSPGATFPVVSSSGGKLPSGTITYNANKEGLFWLPVVARDNACPVLGVTTKMVGLNVKKTLGIKTRYVAGSKFSAFPNPFSEAVTFRLSALSKAESILIYNLLGQQIDEIAIPKSIAGEEELQWQNASKHAAGTYLAKLISEDKTIQTLKFVKLQ